jgi:hypothetical protein
MPAAHGPPKSKLLMAALKGGGRGGTGVGRR